MVGTSPREGPHIGGISPRDNPNVGSTAGVVPDSTAQGPPPGSQIPKAMDKEGTIGKQFTDRGALGGMAESIGGPFAKEGAIGKQFTEEGSLGGTVQNAMGGTKSKKM